MQIQFDNVIRDIQVECVGVGPFVKHNPYTSKNRIQKINTWWRCYTRTYKYFGDYRSTQIFYESFPSSGKFKWNTYRLYQNIPLKKFS